MESYCLAFKSSDSREVAIYSNHTHVQNVHSSRWNLRNW